MLIFRNKFILLLLVCGFLTVGCDLEDTIALEEEPVSQLSPAAISDAKGIESIVIGGYSYWASSRLAGGDWGRLMLALSDQVDLYPTAGGTDVSINDFNIDDGNSRTGNSWTFMFRSIAACNTAISAAAGIEDEAGRNRVLGEARFLRAFNYYHLVRMYGELPIMTEVASTSAAADALNEIPRSPVSQIYDEIIIPDLIFAREWLPDVKNGGTRTRATRGTAAGCLASAYLTLGNYQNAYNEAKFVIDNASSFGYVLEDNFQDLFDATKATQLQEPMLTIPFTSQVFQFPFQDDVLPPATGIPIRGPFRGWGNLVPSLATFESFIEGDYRRDVSFQTEVQNSAGETINYQDYPSASSNSSQPALPHIAKFRRLPGNIKRPVGRESDHDYILMRYAEVLLIAAEAGNEVNGPSGEVYDYINQLRARARLAGGENRALPADLQAGLSQDEFRDAVMNERRMELAFEFKRWYDIKRRDLGNEAFTGANSLEPKDGFDPTRYLMPLPANQLTFNAGWQQNPGY